MDPWASLTTDLLLVIFLILEPAAVLRCTGVCKTWRRAIIGNASIIGTHLDRFFGRSLLLGVFHHSRDSAWLQRTPGPFKSALPWNDGGDNEIAAVHSLIPASSAGSSGGGVDRCLYKELLCSSDGFILLMASNGNNQSLCLCNPMTGDFTYLPSAAATASAGKYCTYFLLTSYEGLSPPSGTGKKLVARILAVHTRERYNEIKFFFKLEAKELSYQIFSTSGDSSGKWGSVKRSVGDFAEGLCVQMDRWTMVVCGDTVYWLAGAEGYITSVLALDVGNGKTWTTELPKECHFRMNDVDLGILAMSSDGRLSLIQTFKGKSEIKVWVLTGNPGWTQQQTILIASKCLIAEDRPKLFSFCAFCPRSRCVVAMSSELGLEYLIDLGTSSSRAPVMRISNCDGLDCCPYEIDCSATYITRMKHF